MPTHRGVLSLNASNQRAIITMTAGTSLVPQRLNSGRPILTCVASHSWENRVTFNPACVLIEDTNELSRIIAGLPFDDPTKQRLRGEPALCFLLYRAQGTKTAGFDGSRSSIGLAVFTPGLTLLARHEAPVILPDQDYDHLGVEDGRLTAIDGRFVLLYTAYSSSHPKNVIRIAMASTDDFVHWEKHGLLKGTFNTIDNKNALLFPDKINGKYIILHRPMKGADAMCIHWAEADSLDGEWKSNGALIKPLPNNKFAATWVGGGAPPLRLSHGRYLLLYHIGNRRADGSREYDLGVAVADFSHSVMVRQRSEPLMRPGTPSESLGDAEFGVNNVVFVCGAYFHEGDLIFPYGGADSVVLGGKIARAELEQYLSR